ncbi:MAG: hypothetical protein HC824_10425 [Synechococcales cyanobacterium RM1_1_8]|nr:hypothetical protein [Synechococcales cyanobacterium RM1_1_8]
MGFSGGLMVRLLNPDSVAGLSGLGRAQTFPAAEWPGQTALEDLPNDVPQPEWEAPEARDVDGDLPEVNWEADIEEVPLDIPSDQLEESVRSPQRDRFSSEQSPPAAQAGEDGFAEDRFEADRFGEGSAGAGDFEPDSGAIGNEAPPSPPAAGIDAPRNDFPPAGDWETGEQDSLNPGEIYIPPESWDSGGAASGENGSGEAMPFEPGSASDSGVLD